jgi:hypothetical protein
MKHTVKKQPAGGSASFHMICGRALGVGVQVTQTDTSPVQQNLSITAQIIITHPIE